MNGPDLMVVDKVACQINRPIGKAVRAAVKHAIRFEKAAAIDERSGGIFDRDADPRLIEVAYLGDERVADILILNDDGGLNELIGLE